MHTNLGLYHGENSYIIKGTLLEQQNTFSSVSRPTLEECSKFQIVNLQSLFKWHKSGSGLSVYLNSDLPFPLYLTFHSKNFPENAHLITTSTLFKL
jgi:hypothetical protein